MGKASRRKTHGRLQSLWAKARATVQTEVAAGDIRLLENVLPQEQKISNALAALLTSEVPEGSPLNEYQAALGLIVIAWNISIQDASADMLNDLEAASGLGTPTQKQEILGLIDSLIAKKKAMFPNDKRTVVAADVQFIGRSRLHVTGIASLSPGRLEGVS